MKLREIYELAVAMGMSHDPRGEKGIQKELDRQKRIYDWYHGSHIDGYGICRSIHTEEHTYMHMQAWSDGRLYQTHPPEERQEERHLQP